MTKIYMVKQGHSNLKILEVELIKATAEQLRIDNENIQVLWSSDDNTKFPPYLSSRLQRHRIAYFDTLSAAIVHAIDLTNKRIEQSIQQMKNSQDQLAALLTFVENQKETSDAG